MKGVFAVCAAVAALSAVGADNAESGAFIYDTRYAASGLTPDFSSAETWGLSPRFSLWLVDLAKDSNNDRIPDWWEEQYGLSGEAASADHDGDGFTNLEEYNMGTDPTKEEDWLAAVKASDRAFIADTRIVYAGEKPVFGEAFCVFAVSDGFVCDTDGLYYDWDGDGVATWWNASIPRDGSGSAVDSDGDGIPDWWLSLYGLDGVDDVAEKDLDGDGMTNYEEFVAGTDPTDALSFFAITSVQIEVVADPETDGFALQWPSVKGRVYTVYAADALVGPWVELAELDGSGATLTHRSDGTRTARFFKVAVRLK